MFGNQCIEVDSTSLSYRSSNPSRLLSFCLTPLDISRRVHVSLSTTCFTGCWTQPSTQRWTLSSLSKSGNYTTPVGDLFRIVELEVLL